MPPRLKSLELHGYKTFASRTEFQFPGDITAIVGPNGSGKSNISDALRWVLGEQSFSLLRGRKTEDMIFSGSEQRSKAGMASATILFDNADGWLPIDYSEVAITRRAYRDGQNEYLLNGQRVRLREISELLAQSGLAERTYTIIGQGLVDAALALKPEERRKLFEEAAGIGLYRSRRDEAINRLDNTKRNLERVQDILAELEPRLRSLEKQARRVDEYDRYSKELRTLLREWYGYHWHHAQTDLAHAQEVQHSQDVRADQARTKYEQVNRNVLEARSQIQEIRTRLNAWHSRSAELHNGKERVSRELAILEERQRALSDQKQNTQSDLARIEEEVVSLQDRIKQNEELWEAAKKESEDAKNQVADSQKAFDSRLSERSQAERELQTARQARTTAETRLVQQKAHLDELQHRAEALQKTLEGGGKTVLTDKDELEKAQSRLNETQKVVQDALAVKTEIRQKLDESKQEIDELEKKKRSFTDERIHLDSDRARLQARLEVLEQAEKSFSGLAEGAKALLEASKKGHVNGAYTSLNGLLVVPPQYEAAITAALGEYFDIIFARPGTDPDQTLKWLETSEKGRAGLLASDWMVATDAMLAPDDPDCIGRAVDLVSVPDEIHAALDTLLGSVLVVRDRTSARRLAAQNKYARIVTLKGELFLPNGVVFSGKETRGGILSRPRQKQEIVEGLAAVAVQIAGIAKDIVAHETEIAAARAYSSELEKTSRESDRKADLANQSAQQAALAVEQARRQLDWQEKQQKNAQAQVDHASEETRNVAAEITKLEQSIVDLREQVHLASGKLGALPLEEFQAQVARLHTVSALSERAVKDCETRLSEYKASLLRSQQQMNTLHDRIGTIDTNQATIETDKAKHRGDEAVLSTEIEELRLLIEPAEKDLETAEIEYARLQDGETAAQQALTTAERFLTQSQLELGKQRELVDNLKRRIEEDFGLVAFEYAEDVSGQTPLPLDGMVEQLPELNEIPPDLEASISRQRAQIRRLGAINPEAQTEYHEVKERFEFMTNQVTDLHKADADLRQIISELNELMKTEFRKTFDAVASEFKVIFTRLFEGGSSRLVLVEGEDPTEPGIEIETRLPGKREQGLTLLSGGERSLTAVALVFSLLKVSPTPFCVMDEVDAMLDEANVGRFRDMLRELSQTTQFIVITHNRNTVQAADVIYGVTMGRDSTSQVMSLKLDEISEDMVK